MPLKERMISILTNRHSQGISFSFTGSSGQTVSVNGTSFQRVADALRGGTVNVISGGAFPGAARYSARLDLRGGTSENTFYVGENDYSSPLFHALIVHESVHASFDLTRSVLPWVDNEAAAYIAQGYYLRNARARVGALTRVGAGNETYLGVRLVEAVQNGETFNNFWLDQLRGSLLADPLYHDKIRGTFTGDG